MIAKKEIDELKKKAKKFCLKKYNVEKTDGKSIGTLIEKEFKAFIGLISSGNTAKGIDLPEFETDIKVTSINKPQSSSPYENAEQKIFGLGHNLLVFVYKLVNKKLEFVSCSYIPKENTSDYGVTSMLVQMKKDGANKQDIIGFLNDKKIPANNDILSEIADRLLSNNIKIGCLSISNALQWRLSFNKICPNINGQTKNFSNNEIRMFNVFHIVNN